MGQDWKEHLEGDRRLIALNKIRSRRHRQLATDSVFVLATEKLQKRLESCYSQDRKTVSEFFRLFSWPVASKLQKMEAFFRSIQNRELKKTLREYVQHANRFRVVFVLRRRARRFDVVELLPSESKFRMEVINGRFAPFGSQWKHADEQSIDVSFHDEKADVPRPLAKAIESGEAKFVRIDDGEGSTCLSILEQATYFPEGLTFILHKAEQPYLMCLIGEKTSTELWRALSTTVSAMLRRTFDRGKAGRPKDLSKRRQAQNLLKKSGRLKDAAIALSGPAGNMETQQSYLSRLRKK